MKKYFVIFLSSLMISSCALFIPRQTIQQGMSENRFLRLNREAVISSIDGPSKTYRVTRDDRFYVLATFRDGELVDVEERELTPAWLPNQPQPQQQQNQYQQQQQPRNNNN